MRPLAVDTQEYIPVRLDYTIQRLYTYMYGNNCGGGLSTFSGYTPRTNVRLSKMDFSFHSNSSGVNDQAVPSRLSMIVVQTPPATTTFIMFRTKAENKWKKEKKKKKVVVDGTKYKGR